MSDRQTGFQRALGLLTLMKSHVIVEIGTCWREKNDWSDGRSTDVFATWLNEHGGHLTSVDVSPEHAATSRRNCPFPEVVTWIVGDGTVTLKTMHPPVSLLYLDGHDFDASDPTPCQETQLREASAALHLLGVGSLVLMDDHDLPKGGKTRLALPFLLKHGFVLEHEGYGALVRRERLA